MQEAYRPRSMKYSICYPVRGGVPSPRRGTPPARSDGGRGCLRGVPPLGYPPPARSDGGLYPRWSTPVRVPPCRSTPSQVWRGCLRGVPPIGVPPGQVWWGGYPSCGTPVGVPPARWGTPLSGYPHWSTPPPLAGPGWGTQQTKWNYYLSSRTTYAVGKYHYYTRWPDIGSSREVDLKCQQLKCQISDILVPSRL